MRPRIRFLTKHKEYSNILLIVVLLLIFHFLYYYLVIHTTLTLPCMPYEEFWTWTDESGVGLFKLFILIFLLFGLWAFLEMIIAHKHNYQDKKICTIGSILILIYIVYLMMSFKSHWESFEVKWGIRDYQDISFKYGYMPENPIKTPWDKFIAEKECINPDYDREFRVPEDHENYWNEVLLEFYNAGGTVEDIKQSNHNIKGSVEAYDLYRKQGIDVIISTEEK